MTSENFNWWQKGVIYQIYPRITYIEEQARWLIAYTAYSESGPLVSLAATGGLPRLRAPRADHAARGQKMPLSSRCGSTDAGR